MQTLTLHRPKAGPVNNLIPAIRRSGVLDPREIETVATRVAAGTVPTDPRWLAARLVKQGRLTEYQARHLLHGRPESLAVGRYIILDRLGQGAMGRVYKARHRMIGHTVALKIVSSARPPGREGVARFLREMRLVSRLDHPHIVRALDADLVQGVPFFVMEYVPGTTLEGVFRGYGALPPTTVARYAYQAALGLAHAHERGVVHRDVKPSNLMIGEGGNLKILDLGLGALIGDDGADASFATADGIVIGTVDYISPEAAAGREADGRSDLYSLGCTMYHLLSGRLPFLGDSKVERLAGRILGRAEPLRALRPELPGHLTTIVDRLMSPRPEDRYASGLEVAAALQVSLERALRDVAPPSLRRQSDARKPGGARPSELPVPHSGRGGHAIGLVARFRAGFQRLAGNVGGWLVALGPRVDVRPARLQRTCLPAPGAGSVRLDSLHAPVH